VAIEIIKMITSLSHVLFKLNASKFLGLCGCIYR